MGVPSAYAIITARGGSKRIPGKNIRSFHGKPLIVWTIQNLINSGLFAEVIVSTDSEDIAYVSKDAGATVPFVRPASLADDYATTAMVADHAIRWLLANGAESDGDFCIVYPAAIAVDAQDISGARDHFRQSKLDLVFAACEFPSPPSRGWRKSGRGDALPVSEQDQTLRTQDVEIIYYDAGQFYWSNCVAWHRINNGQRVRRGLYVLPRWRAIDIDTEEDWEIAERLFRGADRAP